MPILSQPASEWLAANATTSAKHFAPAISVAGAIVAAGNVWFRPAALTAAFAEYGRIDWILPSADSTPQDMTGTALRVLVLQLLVFQSPPLSHRY